MHCIIQARMNSTRLPNKIMKLIRGKPALYYLIDRLRKSKLLTNISISHYIKNHNMNNVSSLLCHFTIQMTQKR